MIITTYDINKQNSKTITATKWFKNGDHPDDMCLKCLDGELSEGLIVRYYRHPNMAGHIICPFCGKTMHEHGWIDGTENQGFSFVVCPGDYIIKDNGLYYACNNVLFDLMFDYRKNMEKIKND